MDGCFLRWRISHFRRQRQTYLPLPVAAFWEYSRATARRPSANSLTETFNPSGTPTLALGWAGLPRTIVFGGTDLVNFCEVNLADPLNIDLTPAANLNIFHSSIARAIVATKLKPCAQSCRTPVELTLLLYRHARRNSIFRSQFSFSELSHGFSASVSGRLACHSRNSASNFARYSGRTLRRRDSAPRAFVAIIFI
jgi:hypothetical protein